MSAQERGTPAANYGSVEQPHLEQPARKCCRTIKYRVRYFYSKGACLVLLWTTLTCIASSEFASDLITDLLDEIKKYSYYYCAAIMVVPSLACVPLAGWLADAKCGNYKLFKAGSVLLFAAVTVGRLGKLAVQQYMAHLFPQGVPIVQIVSGSLGMVGISTSLITGLQLGLDQMPDASADNITSFIAWFACSIFSSLWIVKTILLRAVLTCGKSEKNYIQNVGLYLMSPMCMAIVCCTIFIFAPRYLVVEPKSPRSLKTVYQVLKFAAKHKAPLNRSAFTYWEEDIPSRMDLGKSKYGGPFTTEQVENVKTFFKISIMWVPIFLVFLALYTREFEILPLEKLCYSQLLSTFTSDHWWSAVVTTVIYEFIIFPFFRNKVPNSLKRIGIAAFLVFVIKCSYLAESAAGFNSTNPANSEAHSSAYQIVVWVDMAISILTGSVTMFLFTGVLEFVCAQSPYNMRGLLTSCTVFQICSSIVLSTAIQWVSTILTINDSILCNSISTAVSLIGFILYCLLARWYKRRVRDEDYSIQRVVEEVYDRYLSHVH